MAENIVIRETKLLHKNDWRILRTITIISNKRNRELGVIFYTRPWIETYHNGEDFSKQPTEQDKDSIVDDIIFESIRNKFPKSEIRNSDIKWDYEYQAIEQKKNSSRELKSKIEIFFIPHNDFDLPQKEAMFLTIPFNIYSQEHDTTEIIFFEAKDHITEKNVLDLLLTTVKFL